MKQQKTDTNQNNESLTQFYAKFYLKVGSLMKWPLFVILITIIALSLIILISGSVSSTKYNVFAIETESMTPTLNSGDLILTKSSEDRYRVDQIISFKINPKDSKPITHRIIEVKQEGITRYQTQGDNNDSPDPYQLSEKQIVGEVIYHIPGLGHLILFARSVEGIILLFIIPITILLTLNAQSIYRWLQSIAEGNK